MLVAKRLAPILACLLLVVFVVRDDIEVNGDAKLAMVYAIVDHGTLAVDGYIEKEPPVISDLGENGGHYYTAKPPLPSLILVPLYGALRIIFPPADLQSWWWRWALTILGAAVPFVILPFLLRAIGRDDPEMRGPRAHAFGATAVVIATPLVVYATVFFSHVLAAALLLGLLAVTVSPKPRPVAAGLLLGALVSTELLPAAAGGILFAYGRLRELRGGSVGLRSSALSLGGLGVASVPLLLFQWAAFGSPLANMYASIADPFARAAYAAGGLRPPQPDVALYLLVSPQQGVLVFSPIILAGAIGLLQRWRMGGADRRAAQLSVATAIGGLVILSSFTLWYDGSQYGPRYLTPFIPLLLWPIAGWPKRRVAAIATVAALPQLMALMLSQPMLSPQAGTYGEVALLFFSGRFDPNLVGLAAERLGVHGATFIAAIAVLLAVEAALLAPIGLRPKRDG